MPAELLDVFSKRSAAIDVALDAKVDEFRQREGRDPSRWERAALTREASADTRAHKSGHGVPDLATRWQSEAAGVGWTAERLTETIAEAGRRRSSPRPVTVSEVLDELSESRSAWGRADVLRAMCDRQRPAPQCLRTRLGRLARAGNRPDGRRPGRPRPRHARVASRLGWSVGAHRTDRRPLHDPGHPHPGGSRPRPGRRSPSSTTRRHRRRSAGAASTRCKPQRQRRSPATTD